MPLDLSLPLELDDGTPVQFLRPCGNDAFAVRVPKSPLRKGHSTTPNDYWYDRNGFFGGNNDPINFYTIRNSGPAPREEYEDWFVG